jgi:Putative zincin peptidase
VHGLILRTFNKINDPILKRAQSLDATWRPIGSVGISLRARRILFYLGIVIFGAVISAPTVIFGLDPIQAIREATAKFGSLFVVLITGVVLIALPLIHEALHLAAHPDFGRSNSTIVGGNIAMLFVLYDGPMTKQRMVIYLLLPFVGLLIILCAALTCVPALWPVWVLFSGNHLAMCTGDLLLLWKLLRVRGPIQEVWNCGTVLMARGPNCRAN